MLSIQMVRAMLGNQKGQGMVEYGLILAAIAVIALVALTPLGAAVALKFTNVAASL